jgi:hypothetical protein
MDTITKEEYKKILKQIQNKYNCSYTDSLHIFHSNLINDF